MTIEHVVVNPTKQTGVMLTDDDGNQYPETVTIAGYHVNTTQPVEAWTSYQVFPTSPASVYAGLGVDGTSYYMFPDQATFEGLLDAG